jgi:hypothetical protein
VYRRLPGLSVRATKFVIELAEQEFSGWNAATGRPKALSVVEALRLCLCWLRRNLTLPEAGEDFGIGTTTAWGYAHLMAEFLADALGCPAEDLADQVAGKVILFDGTLVPTFNWRHRRDLHSGKHKRPGLNVQAVGDIHGRVAGASRPFPGSWHDKHCYDEAGLEQVAKASGGGVGDSGYQGTGLVTPIKKKPGLELTEEEKRFNASVASVRVGAEHAIAHLKNWRIVASRYRGHLDYRADNVILAVVGLQALNDRLSDRKLSFARFKNG